MLLRQPLINRRRQKEPGLAVDRPEVAHRRNVLEKRAKRALILSGPSYGVKSDRLLETIQGDLVTAAVTALGATDVMHFLGRKPHPAFAGEVTIDSRKRLPDALPPQAVKFYDHANVFRVETTLNNPREFKVLRSPDDGTDQ